MNKDTKVSPSTGDSCETMINTADCNYFYFFIRKRYTKQSYLLLLTHEFMAQPVRHEEVVWTIQKIYPKQDKMALHPIPWSSVGF